MALEVEEAYITVEHLKVANFHSPQINLSAARQLLMEVESSGTMRSLMESTLAPLQITSLLLMEVTLQQYPRK